MQISRINSTSFNGLFKRKRKAKPELTPEEQAAKSKNRKTFIRGMAAGGAVIAGLGGAAQALPYVIPQETVLEMPYQEGVTDVNRISNILNVDGRTYIISEAGDTVSFHPNYDYLDNKIEDAQDDLYKTSDEKKAEKLFSSIVSMKEKQEYQKEIATVYTNGEQIFFTLFPHEGQEERTISVADFKEAFDIKDDALSKHPENNIAYDWTRGEYYTQDGVICDIPAGTTLVVDMGSIDTNNINFDY